MINLTEEMILTAGARECRAQLSVRKCPAKRTNAADRPKRHDGKASGQIPNLKAEAGEDTSADHIGYHDAGSGEERNRSPALR